MGTPTLNSPTTPMNILSFARVTWRLSILLLVSAVVAGCQPASNRERARTSQSSAPESDAPYQAEVEEGLGAAVAILVDTSG